MHWEAHELALPKISESSSWNVKICSADDESVSVIDNKNTSYRTEDISCINSNYKKY